MPTKPALLLLLAVLIGLLPFAYRIAEPFIGPLLAAAVIAVVVQPLHARLRGWLKRPVLAAALTTTLAFIAGAVILGVVGAALAQELGEAYQALNQRSAQQGGWIALAENTTGTVLDWLASRLPIDQQAAREELFSRMRSGAAGAAQAAGRVLGGVTSSLVNGFLAVFLLYFCLLLGEDWLHALRRLLPLEPAHLERIESAVRDTVVANVHGILAVALGQGIALGSAFWFLGLPSPVTWGVIGALFSMVPVVGTLLIWAPFAAALAIQGAYWKAILLAVWGLLVVGSVDNVVRPLIVGGRVKQHPVLIVFSMLGGTHAFGAAGILIGPLVVATLLAVLQSVSELAPEWKLPAAGPPQPPEAA